MSGTTEILFNSPGLHTLRRDQLQKLCKYNFIKANGKNTELVERLRVHALTLPKDDPLSVAARSEMDLDDEDGDVDTDDGSHNPNKGPGKQWGVMESIQEVEENLQGTSSPRASRTMNSGELETMNPKATVGSSIRALAVSLGLKQAVKPGESSTLGSSRAVGQPNDELAQYSIPYSAIRAATPPLYDDFTFGPATTAPRRMSYAADTEPLPGCPLRPGEPAPDNARLSMDIRLADLQQQPINTTESKELSQPTTTIRLVSSKSSSSSVADNYKSEFEPRRDTFQTPKLKPFATTFDLVISPSAARSGAFWAPDTRPGPFEKIYPALTIDDLPPDVPSSPVKKAGHGTIGNSASKDKGTLSMSKATTTVSPEPFIFGSPLHSVSNTQFQAAATSVLEEMNKRLGTSGVEGVGMEIVTKLQPGVHTQAQLACDVKPLPSLGTGGGMKGDRKLTKKFEDMHKAEFDKMEGIDGLIKRKMERNNPSLSSTAAQVAGTKRKSNVLGELDREPRKLTTEPLNVAGSDSSREPMTKGMVPPGGLYDEDQEDKNEEDREGRGGKRLRMDPDTNSEACKMDADNKNDKEIKRIEGHDREREVKAIKRKLEISRAKRRSSVGGILAAATKSAAIRNSKLRPATPKSKPSSKFGLFTTAAKSLVASVWNIGKNPVSKSIAGDGVTAPTKSSLLKQKGGTNGFAPTKSSVKPMATTVDTMTKANASTVGAMGMATVDTANAMTAMTVMKDNSRATAPVMSQPQDASGMGRARSRPPLPPSFCSKSQITSSSLWTSSAVSGSGNKIQPDGTATQIVPKPTSGSGSGGPSSLTSSRLLAPTASSLAKMKSSATLHEPATNSLRGGLSSRRAMLSPRSLRGSRNIFMPNRNAANSNNGGKIFSKPKLGILTERTGDGDARGKENEDIEMDGVSKTSATTRQLTFAKKPRSKVVAKLASQRSTSSPFKPTAMMKLSALPSVPRTKLGPSLNGTVPVPTTPKAHTKRIRSSFAPVKGHVRGGSADTISAARVGVKERSVLDSAKKRVRQSEIARRRSVRMN